MASPVVLEKLTRRYHPASPPAVDALDLDVAEGEVLCVVGPSGCGKSTTLRMVAGLETPDVGRILIGGKDMRGVPPQERDVAMVFQGFALYPHMKAKDILAFPLRMRKVPRAERQRSVGRTAELLGISHLLERRPAELSGGEQQRVAMGRAIVRNPAAFLFDEPLSNLDAALRAELRVELGRLLRELNATALYVTHDQVEAMTLGRRIALLRAGRLEQLATPRAIYEHPQSVFTASFFGSPPMNLWNAERDDQGAHVHGIRLPAPPPSSPEQLVFGLRPEHIEISANNSDRLQGHAHFAATVKNLEPLGAETHLELDVQGQTLKARVPGLDAPGVGRSIYAVFALGNVRWFDRESGRSL